jgi:HAD superfamily hydrolase (TIGR01509 family)
MPADPIAAVIFDLDGVIIDTETVWERERRGFVADHGGSWPDDAQRRLMGMSTPEWAAYLAEDADVGLPADEVATEVIERMRRAYDESLPVIPGAPEAVLAVASRWPVAVASSSPAALITAALEAAGLSSAFRATVSSEEVPRGKPAPDVYLEAARRLGIAPAACVAVEDSSNGLRSAAAAGMRVVAVPQPHYPPDPDALSLAVVQVDSIAGLPDALNAL